MGRGERPPRDIYGEFARPEDFKNPKMRDIPVHADLFGEFAEPIERKSREQGIKSRQRKQ